MHVGEKFWTSPSFESWIFEASLGSWINSKDHSSLHFISKDHSSFDFISLHIWFISYTSFYKLQRWKVRVLISTTFEDAFVWLEQDCFITYFIQCSWVADWQISIYWFPAGKADIYGSNEWRCLRLARSQVDQTGESRSWWPCVHYAYNSERRTNCNRRKGKRVRYRATVKLWTEWVNVQWMTYHCLLENGGQLGYYSKFTHALYAMKEFHWRLWKQSRRALREFFRVVFPVWSKCFSPVNTVQYTLSLLKRGLMTRIYI